MVKFWLIYHEKNDKITNYLLYFKVSVGLSREDLYDIGVYQKLKNRSLRSFL